jgi:serine/threonine protein kinase
MTDYRPLTRLGHYQIIAQIGHGGFGTVYKALDSLGRTVAIKVLSPGWTNDPAAIERFRREAQSAGELFHSHIATIMDFHENEGRLYLVMRYVEGTSLDQILKERPPLPWDEALSIVQDIAGALDHAHLKGYIHRDVKPANILVSARDGAVLTDFGLVKAAQSSGLSTTGVILGTPNYIAPEIWQGQDVSPATDIYSLACVFYEMITGTKLFAGDSSPQVMTRHMLTGPQFPEKWPAGVPEGIESVLRKGLDKEPLERYKSSGEFVQALSQIASAQEPEIVTPSIAGQLPVQPASAEPAPDSIELEGLPLPPAIELTHYRAPVRIKNIPPKRKYDVGLLNPAPYWLAVHDQLPTLILTGTPPAGSSGSYTFRLMVGDTASRSITLTVKPARLVRKTHLTLLAGGIFLLVLLSIGLFALWKANNPAQPSATLPPATSPAAAVLPTELPAITSNLEPSPTVSTLPTLENTPTWTATIPPPKFSLGAAPITELNISQLEMLAGIKLAQDIFNVTFTADGKSFIAHSHEQVFVFDLDAQAVVNSFTTTTTIASLALSDKLIAVASVDGNIYIFRMDGASFSDGTSVQIFSIPGGVLPRRMALSRDGTLLAAGLDDGSITLFDTSAGPIVTLPVCAGQQFPGLAFSATTNKLVSVCDQIILWNANRGGLAELMREAATWGEVAISPDDQVVIYDGTTARFWAIMNQELYHVFDYPTSIQAGNAVAISGENMLVAFGNLGQVEIRHHPGGMVLTTLNIGNKIIRGLSFSPDQTLVALALDDGTVQLWGVLSPNAASTPTP